MCCVDATGSCCALPTICVCVCVCVFGFSPLHSQSLPVCLLCRVWIHPSRMYVCVIMPLSLLCGPCIVMACPFFRCMERPRCRLLLVMVPVPMPDSRACMVRCRMLSCHVQSMGQPALKCPSQDYPQCLSQVSSDFRIFYTTLSTHAENMCFQVGASAFSRLTAALIDDLHKVTCSSGLSLKSTIHTTRAM